MNNAKIDCCWKIQEQLPLDFPLYQSEDGKVYFKLNLQIRLK